MLLFPDPRTAYTLAVPDTAPALPARSDVEAALAKRNPELESALATSHLADLNVVAARSAYLPDLELNYSYGIDAAQFAATGIDGSRNLGYSASATLNIPIWDWFATHDKVRQSEINRDVARVTLTNTQRKLIAELEEFYSEAVAAHDQLDSLNQSVATAAEILRLMRISYSAGETAILEVVDAENSLDCLPNLPEKITMRRGSLPDRSREPSASDRNALNDDAFTDRSNPRAVSAEALDGSPLRCTAAAAGLQDERRSDADSRGLCAGRASGWQGSISDQIAADAILTPLAQAAISPKVTAPVKQFYVQRGAKVHEGELLATLENSDLAAAALDNKGSYTAAQATYETATKATAPEDLTKAKLDLAQAKANLDLAQSIVNARTQLLKEGAIPGRDLDTAQATLVQQQAAFDIAKQHLESLQNVSNRAALENAQGNLESAKGKYLGAQAELSYTEIRSARSPA